MPDPFRIETITAFLAIGKDGDEGVCGAQMGDTFMPLVCGDHTRVEKLREVAQMIATRTNSRITVAQFSIRTDLEEIHP